VTFHNILLVIYRFFWLGFFWRKSPAHTGTFEKSVRDREITCSTPRPLDYREVSFPLA
jgi:hypothetical protein